MRKYATQIPHMKRILIRQYTRTQWKQSLRVPPRTDSVRGIERTERQPRGETIYIGSQGSKGKRRHRIRMGTKGARVQGCSWRRRLGLG